ncbi:MAG: 3-oxoadipate enol-lactonase [Gemmatimonadaceae bacterium]|nr:3-oxoadipate enol-lactonase [Acetobacteraceae bacterium]
MPMVAANGTELFYDLTGPEGAPVVAFSNSLGTTLEMWDAQARALAGRTRVLRYDTRGHGRSPTVDKPATIDTLADDLAGLLDALGINRAHVVGLSLGGMTAQSLAARRPAQVHGLVLMATSAYLPQGWTERAVLVREAGMGAIVDATMARWFTPPCVQSAPAYLTAQRDRFLAIDPRGYAVCCGAIGGMDLRPGNGAIAAPTLIIAGADDTATPPAMSEDIRSRIADAELVVLPRAAHLLAVERAELVNRHLLAFLGALGDVPAAPAEGSSFEAGRANRQAVLGVEHVQRSLANAGGFAGPWQDFITRVAWGEVWGDDTIPWKTRSTVTLALMVALGREEEFKLHLRPALRNGVSLEELRALLIHCAVYAGVPAANGAFRWARDVLGDELAES